ncbi:MAG: rhamnan synthesis F family protein, partial [Burkholderiaceae bacterium]|nr:rhamnan synthesis F family protein [Burkholderiaceae bacterium]
ALPASQARIYAIKPLAPALSGEVCFFVSFAPSPQIKLHVRRHVEHLLRAGVNVVLILNTDLLPEQFVLDDELTQQLSGLFVRENVGFDFAAWAHMFTLCEGVDRWTRLFLVNDSVVGPLNAQDFARVMGRIRTSNADMLGLTESKLPLPHVQSFFLVFNNAALKSPEVQRIFQRILNLPTKELVIDVYETRLTNVLVKSGLLCETLFPSLANDPHSANDIYYRWDQLIQAGFPYIKTRILTEFGASNKVKELVPVELLQPDS